jgi:hypothetical protein
VTNLSKQVGRGGPEGRVSERRLAGGVTPARRGLVTNLSKQVGRGGPEGRVSERRLAGGVTPARRGLVTNLSNEFAPRSALSRRR